MQGGGFEPPYTLEADYSLLHIPSTSNVSTLFLAPRVLAVSAALFIVVGIMISPNTSEVRMLRDTDITPDMIMSASKSNVALWRYTYI